MPVNQPPIRANFGLLPEAERSTSSILTSAAINLLILFAVLYLGMTAKRVIQAHKFEQTELIFPTTPSSATDEAEDQGAAAAQD